MNLTNREKSMLMVLCLVAIVAVFILLIIKPLNESNSAKQQELTNAAETEMMMKALISEEDSIKATYVSSKEDYQKAVESFPRIQKSYDLHTMITSLCAKNGVDVTDLQIQDYKSLQGDADAGQAAVTSEAAPTAEGAEAKADDGDTNQDAQQQADLQEEYSNWQLYVCDVNITIKGAFADLIRTENAFQHYMDNIGVSGFAITDIDAQGGVNTATMMISVYAVDQ